VTTAERKPTSGRTHMTPLGLFIPWRWESAFLGIARSPAAQSSVPGEAGIPRGRLADCFRCAVKTRGLEKGNAEEWEFFFIWGGYVGFGLPRRSVHFAKDGACLRGFVLGRDRHF
jgi:hypothetical protein